MSQTLQQAIIEKYIVPTERKPDDFIGVEFEFPLINFQQKLARNPPPL